MKKKALIKVLAAPEDLAQLQGVFDHLRSSGVVISGKKGSLGKKDIVLAVLSEHFYQDETLKAQLFDQLAVGAENILPLNLAEEPVPEEIMNLLFARNIIMSSGRSDEQLAERILSAIPEKKNPMTAVFAVAVAALFLLGGLFLWRSMDRQETEPAITVEEPVPNPLGITEEELAEIKDVVIIGDSFTYYTYEDYVEFGHWPDVNDLAYEVEENGERHWYSTEDGHEFTMTRYEDLQFLSLMPNLDMLRMVLVDVDADKLPDFSSFGKITEVNIYNCAMTELDWLSGSTISHLDVCGTNIADYGSLTNCESLSRVNIDGQWKYHGDLSGFAPPVVVELSLQGMDTDAELSALSRCKNLTYLRLGGLQIRDLDFVKEMQALKTLDIGNLQQLRDISGISALADLRELHIWQCDQVRDYMPINACRRLETIHIDRGNWIPVDSAFLNGLSRLTNIGLYGLNLNNMDFLAAMNQKFGLCLGFCGDIEDYSGLSHVKNYQWMHVNPRSNGGRYGDFSLVAPHIRNVSIGELELFNCTNVDLAALPAVANKLIINRGDLEDLTGLNSQHLQRLELRDMQYLRSLNGIEGLSKLSNSTMELSILGCIRLKDYAALDGASLRSLHLCGMYDLPDFSKFGLGTLRLESMEDVEDLSCLETLSKNGMYHFEFPGLDNLKDLSALRDFRGTELNVPPQVADQAEELVKDGRFINYNVTYPESGWSPMDEEVVLLSMEELETLPKPVLRRVSKVWIAGDEIVDPNRYDVRDEWERDHPVIVLHDRKTDATRKVSTGSIRDFSLLADLTNLWELRLFSQPISDLEGIQNLSNLINFEAMLCTNLQDVSALYALQNLEDISLRYTTVDTIQGVQNLPRLRSLNVSDTWVSDLSPLQECDFSYAEQCGGFNLIVGNSSVEDFSILSAIPSFGHLNVCGYHPGNWMQHVAQTPIRSYCGPMGSDELLREFVQQHPELEEMHIENGYELSDLTPLLELQNLRYVHSWNNAEGAARSLNGHQRQFDLDIDN